jgi:hypothetical protein
MPLFEKKKVKDIKLDKFVKTKLLITNEFFKKNKTLLTITTIGGIYYMLKMFEFLK